MHQHELSIFRRMLLMRRFEERVFALAARNLVVGHFHVYIGQEAAGAAVIDVLDRDDLLLTNHRNHGHLLSRGADPGKLLAEIMAREGGLNRGRGGTLHATCREIGFLQTSALVGGVVPLAVGAAWRLKLESKQRVVVAFFGDGALEEGAVFESFNIAALWGLPVIFVCENNSVGAIGQKGGGYTTSINAASEVSRIPQVFGIPIHVLDGNDISAIRSATSMAVARAREGGGPSFIEAVTVRWPGSQPLWPELATGVTHLGTAFGEPQAESPHAEWIREYDPVVRVARELYRQGVAREELRRLDLDVCQAVDAAQEYAESSPVAHLTPGEDEVFG